MRAATPGAGLLSRKGVERLAVGTVAGLRLMNLCQSAVSLSFAWDKSSAPLLAVGTLGLLAASGCLVLWHGIRAGHLVPWTVAVDLGVALVLLMVAPRFQPADHVQPWMDWPIGDCFVVGAEVAACFPAVLAAASVLMLMAASLTWLISSPPPATRALVLNNLVPFVGFSLVAALFLQYLRRLATLADVRAETIGRLEEERTRRVLHTPYRLLNDLATMLRREALTNGEDPYREARLAEALASVHEIESIVRGTEPASGNLAAELLRLEDQFVDLPLLMNVEDGSADLPPEVAYRVREAVRSALQNVRLHAHATEVVVYAATDPDTWVVSVHDNGRGFEPGDRESVGIRDLMIRSMREIGATARIESTAGQGTLIEFTGRYPWKTANGRE